MCQGFRAKTDWNVPKMRRWCFLSFMKYWWFLTWSYKVWTKTIFFVYWLKWFFWWKSCFEKPSVFPLFYKKLQLYKNLKLTKVLFFFKETFCVNVFGPKGVWNGLKMNEILWSFCWVSYWSNHTNSKKLVLGHQLLGNNFILQSISCFMVRMV